mmetsp:Transcript_75746/g.202788  ORF Transcript_75746/g.202788 Transcript_75746/m.202788 type:complete len:268 (+) Transcript_75746:478-1281(+)
MISRVIGSRTCSRRGSFSNAYPAPPCPPRPLVLQFVVANPLGRGFALLQHAPLLAPHSQKQHRPTKRHAPQSTPHGEPVAVDVKIRHFAQHEVERKGGGRHFLAHVGKIALHRDILCWTEARIVDPVCGAGLDAPRDKRSTKSRKKGRASRAVHITCNRVGQRPAVLPSHDQMGYSVTILENTAPVPSADPPLDDRSQARFFPTSGPGSRVPPRRNLGELAKQPRRAAPSDDTCCARNLNPLPHCIGKGTFHSFRDLSICHLSVGVI